MVVVSTLSKDEAFLICPRCYSKDVSYISNTISILSAQQYKCRDCGYMSELFAQVSEKEYEKIKEKNN